MRITYDLTVEFNKKKRREEKELISALRKYWTKGQPTDFMPYHYYTLDEDNPLFAALVDLQTKYPQLSLQIDEIYLDYSEEEASIFVAFIPAFSKHYCSEYEDVDVEMKTCIACDGNMDFMESVSWDEKSYGKKRLISPEGFIKKAKDRIEVLHIDDSPEVALITPPLYEKLIQDGFSEDNFRKVETKRGVILAYEFIPDAVLPTGALNSKMFKISKKCGKCGATFFDSHSVLKYEPFVIDADLVSKLGTVTKTTDYYLDNGGNPYLMVSPALRNAIVKYCPDAKFIPIHVDKPGE